MENYSELYIKINVKCLEISIYMWPYLRHHTVAMSRLKEDMKQANKVGQQVSASTSRARSYGHQLRFDGLDIFIFCICLYCCLFNFTFSCIFIDFIYIYIYILYIYHIIYIYFSFFLIDLSLPLSLSSAALHPTYVNSQLWGESLMF